MQSSTIFLIMLIVQGIPPLDGVKQW